jgi:hypothetical protein
MDGYELLGDALYDASADGVDGAAADTPDMAAEAGGGADAGGGSDVTAGAATHRDSVVAPLPPSPSPPPPPRLPMFARCARMSAMFAALTSGALCVPGPPPPQLSSLPVHELDAVTADELGDADRVGGDPAGDAGGRGGSE